MRLVWDQNQHKVIINGVEVALAPEDHPPFGVEAQVEEQDIALILSENTSIQHTEDKPLWYYAHKLENQITKKPGTIVVKPGSPLRLLALIHDFDQDPSWREEWILMALNNIVDLVESKEAPSIKLPLLGTQFGHFDPERFLNLLVSTLLQQKKGSLKKIWLVVPFTEIELRLNQLKQACSR